MLLIVSFKEHTIDLIWRFSNCSIYWLRS